MFCVFVITSIIMSEKKHENPFIKIGEAAQMLGISEPTLRKWHKTGEFEPAYVSRGGRRFYTGDQIDRFLKGRTDGK